jgi:2-haloacid dehalogenase
MERKDNNANRPKVILLDVYETILNMADAQQFVNNLLNRKKGYLFWFELFMQYCFVANCINQFNDFQSIAKATMQMAAKSLGETISEHQTDQLLEMLKYLPVYADIQEGLSLLKDQGFRIAALTNSPQNVVKERMERTGLISYFEMVLSAEQLGKYKPSLEVYQWAAEKLNVTPSEILLVSAHGWDLAGGANAQLQTAYIKRKRTMIYPLARTPNMTCKNLINLANQLE